jgi:hypothetical protein
MDASQKKFHLPSERVDDEIIRALMMFRGHPADQPYEVEILHPGDKPDGPGEMMVIRTLPKRDDEAKDKS